MRAMLNRRTFILMILWATATLLIAWSASLQPKLPYETFGVERSDLPYYWRYPSAVACCGVLLVALLRPWRFEHSVTGSAAAFVLLAAAVVYLAITSITANYRPPVHRHTTLLALVLSQIALFYCGYAFAWRKRGPGSG